MGLGCKIGDTVVGFDDMTPEAWARIGTVANRSVLETRDDGTDTRATWLDAYGFPMRDPAAGRAIHEEAVRVVEPGCQDVPARSRELAPSLTALRDAFLVVPDDVPAMEDGSPLGGDDLSISG